MSSRTETARAAARFRWPAGRRAAVSITFDDARPSQLDRGLPILDALGIRATFYVSLTAAEARIDEWRGAASRGHEIGNHTASHPCSGHFKFSRHNALEDYTIDRMRRDILDANAQLEALFGTPPVTFAYPCGQTFVGRGESQRSYVPLVAGHFLVGRRAFDEAPNDPVCCDLAHAMGMDMDCADWPSVKQLIDKSVDEGRWLILLGHEVGDAGRQVTPAHTLEKLCRHCNDPKNDIWIDTVAAVGSYIDRQRRITSTTNGPTSE